MVVFEIDPFTEAELNGARTIRNEVKNIPKDLDTDFYLARWWQAYGGDMSRIQKHMADLFEHRRVLGYDRIPTESLQTFLQIARKTYERFCISSLAKPRCSGNVCVFVQRMIVNDIREVIKVLPLSYVLHSYYILQESYTRAQLESERLSGERAAVVVILDLEGLNIAELLNPFSGPARFARLIDKIWSVYFSETLVKLLIVNSPGILGVMWQITKLLMDKKTQSRIDFLSNPADLLKHLSAKLVPKMYGGDWSDESGYAEIPETVCKAPLRIFPQDYYDPSLIWRNHGFDTIPVMLTESIKGGHTFEVKKICESDHHALVWHFTVSSDVEFSILRMDDEREKIVWPKITLTSLKAPEQGCIPCKEGKYKVRFTNPIGSWLPIRVHYAIETSYISSAS